MSLVLYDSRHRNFLLTYQSLWSPDIHPFHSFVRIFEHACNFGKWFSKTSSMRRMTVSRCKWCQEFLGKNTTIYWLRESPAEVIEHRETAFAKDEMKEKGESFVFVLRENKRKLKKCLSSFHNVCVCFLW